MSKARVRSNPFFLVFARDQSHVEKKIKELERLNVPFRIICGKNMNHPKVIFRKAKGKWDAINFSAKFVPEDADIIVLNDVDTKIVNFKPSLDFFQNKFDLIYCLVKVESGPQMIFYRILNPIRKIFHIAASGELMLMKKEVFDHVLPVPPVIGEDSYILFKSMELGYRVIFNTECYVITNRTENADDEKKYKTRTTFGIYQSLKYCKAPYWIRLFYTFLPFFAPLLNIAGENGRAWSEGIRRGIKMHLQKKNITTF